MTVLKKQPESVLKREYIGLSGRSNFLRMLSQWSGTTIGAPSKMTRQRQKDEERFYADEYLRRRHIVGQVKSAEHPDFLVLTTNSAVGIEVVSYGGAGGREVDSTWRALVDRSAEYRKRNPELNRYSVSMDLRRYRVPPSRLFEKFFAAVKNLVLQQDDLAIGDKRIVRVDPVTHPLLGKYISEVRIKAVNLYLDWQWPMLMNGSIGTTDAELYAAIERKMNEYRPPSSVAESHLVVYGRGPERTRIAAPFSVEQLVRFPKVNRALRDSPFIAAAILGYRDFFWTRSDGWAVLPATPSTASGMEQR